MHTQSIWLQHRKVGQKFWRSLKQLLSLTSALKKSKSDRIVETAFVFEAVLVIHAFEADFWDIYEQNAEYLVEYVFPQTAFLWRECKLLQNCKYYEVLLQSFSRNKSVHVYELTNNWPELEMFKFSMDVKNLKTDIIVLNDIISDLTKVANREWKNASFRRKFSTALHYLVSLMWCIASVLQVISIFYGLESASMHMWFLTTVLGFLTIGKFFIVAVPFTITNGVVCYFRKRENDGFSIFMVYLVVGILSSVVIYYEAGQINWQKSGWDEDFIKTSAINSTHNTSPSM